MTDALLELSSVFLLHMQVRVDHLTIVSETTFASFVFSFISIKIFIYEKKVFIITSS
jgi:hypothetical protein